MYLQLTTNEAEHEETYNDPISVQWAEGGRWQVEVEDIGWQLDSVHDTLTLAKERASFLEAQGLNVRFLPATADLNKAVETMMTTLVCSCGSEHCGLISYYGLPRPLYHDAIEPLESMRRDPTARTLKMELGL